MEIGSAELRALGVPLPTPQPDNVPVLYGTTVKLTRHSESFAVASFMDLPYVPGLPYPTDREQNREAPIFDYYGPNRMYFGSAFAQYNKQLNDPHVEAASRLTNPNQTIKRDIKSYLYEIDQRTFDRVSDQVERYKSTGDAPIIDLSTEPDSFESLRNTLHAVLPNLTFSRVERYRDRGNTIADFFFRVRDGKEVGIDHLSSGEKEVLMVFLELFRTDARNSILLIDEPELHLNASIEARIIPYLDKAFVRGKSDQIFIATHSTAMLSRASDKSLYKISYPDGLGGNQASSIGSYSDRTSLLRDLVGELAVFTTAERFVFIEGELGGKSSDRKILELLFPHYAPQTLFIPAGQNLSVQVVAKKVQQVLEQDIPFGEFYALRDRDRLAEAEVKALEGSRRFKVLSRCMIENYLLDEFAWSKFLSNLGRRIQPAEVVSVRYRAASQMIGHEVSSRLDHKYKMSLSQQDYRDVPDFSSLAKLERLQNTVSDAIQQHSSLKSGVESRVNKELENGTFVFTYDGKRLVDLMRTSFSLSMPMHELLPLLASAMFENQRVPADLTDTLDELLRA